MGTLPGIANKHLPSPPCHDAEGVGEQSTTLPPLRLSHNFFWTFLGNIAQAVSRLLLLVIVVKWNGLETAGLWILTTSLCSSAFACSELGLRSFLVCDVRREYRFQDYYSLRFGLALVAILGLLLFGATTYGLGASLTILAIVALGRAFDSLSDICYGVLQREERMDRIGLGMILRYCGGTIGMSVSLALGYSLVVAASLDSLAAFLVYRFWSRQNAKRLLAGFAHLRKTAQAMPVEEVRLVSPRRLWLSLIGLSIPLGIVAIEINLATNLPRYLVDSILGRESLAVFATILQFAAAGMIFVQAMGNAFAPRLTRYYQAHRLRHFLMLWGRFIGMALALGMIPVVALWTAPGRTILAWMFSPRLLGDLPAIRWLTMAVCLLYLTGPLGRGVTSVLRFRSHVAIRGATLAMMLVVIPPLAKAYGLSGAAMGLTFALATTLPFYGWVILRAWNTRAEPTIVIADKKHAANIRAAA
ncbi:MAG: lipopolysaccharide biosynthesis protein [Thermogutta sp.]